MFNLVKIEIAFYRNKSFFPPTLMNTCLGLFCVECLLKYLGVNILVSAVYHTGFNDVEK